MQATSISGRIDVPMTAGTIVLVALGVLILLNKLTLSLH